jgi:hypothetical protein
LPLFSLVYSITQVLTVLTSNDPVSEPQPTPQTKLSARLFHCSLLLFIVSKALSSLLQQYYKSQGTGHHGLMGHRFVRDVSRTQAATYTAHASTTNCCNLHCPRKYYQLLQLTLPMQVLPTAATYTAHASTTNCCTLHCPRKYYQLLHLTLPTQVLLTAAPYTAHKVTTNCCTLHCPQKYYQLLHLTLPTQVLPTAAPYTAHASTTNCCTLHCPRKCY